MDFLVNFISITADWVASHWLFIGTISIFIFFGIIGLTFWLIKTNRNGIDFFPKK
jgi:hypothetical protein